MKLYVFIRRRIAVSAKKNGFKQHCLKQPCLICFFWLSFCRRKAALGKAKPAFIALVCNFFAEEKLYSIK